MNQQQRKYVTARVEGIRNKRINDIRTAFNTNPNKPQIPFTPAIKYPDANDILLKLAGFDVNVELKYTGDELKSQLKSFQFSTGNYAMYGGQLSNLVNPLNQEELEAFKVLQAEHAALHKTEVDDKIIAINTAYTRCMDTIILGENASEITEAISAFENCAV